jgi:hypothetical protein
MRTVSVIPQPSSLLTERKSCLAGEQKDVERRNLGALICRRIGRISGRQA